MGTLGVMALLGVLRVPQVEHEVDVIAAVGPPNVLTVVRPWTCRANLALLNFQHLKTI